MGRQNGIRYMDSEPEKRKPMTADHLQLDMIPKELVMGK